MIDVMSYSLEIIKIYVKVFFQQVSPHGGCAMQRRVADNEDIVKLDNTLALLRGEPRVNTCAYFGRRGKPKVEHDRGKPRVNTLVFFGLGGET